MSKRWRRKDHGTSRCNTELSHPPEALITLWQVSGRWHSGGHIGWAQERERGCIFVCEVAQGRDGEWKGRNRLAAEDTPVWAFITPINSFNYSVSLLISIEHLLCKRHRSRYCGGVRLHERFLPSVTQVTKAQWSARWNRGHIWGRVTPPQSRLILCGQLKTPPQEMYVGLQTRKYIELALPMYGRVRYSQLGPGHVAVNQMAMLG